MKKTSTMVVILISVPLLSAALMVGFRSAWDKWHIDIPRLECPRTLDLGEQKRGQIAVARFQIKNNGKGVLHLDDFATSCSCMGVEQESNGKFSRIKSLSLAPGQEAPLFIRLGVGVEFPTKSGH